MTVQDLIAELGNYPSTAKILVTSYESGYDHVTFVGVKTVSEVRLRDNYSGQYDDDPNGKKVVVIA